MGKKSKPTIDFASISRSADLPAMMAAEGIDLRRGMAYCPFHENTRTAALSVYRRPDGWRFRCHGCGAKGDAIDWLVAREPGLTKVEAVRRLGGIDPPPAVSRRAPAPPPSPRPDPPPAWSDPAWQEAVDGIVNLAEENLLGPRGSAARDWLRRRGLAAETVSRFRLGWLHEPFRSDPLDCLRSDDGEPRGIFAPRGIVFPWVHPGSWHTRTPDPDGTDPGPRWVGANVRRLAADMGDPVDEFGKCQALRGSARGYGYPLPDLCPGVPALLCEGELDALVGWQEAGWLVDVVTVGSAEQSPRPEVLSALESSPYWLVATDHDSAGARGFKSWWTRCPAKARRLQLPHGKDLGEFRQSGGSVLDWLRSEFTRMGMDWPLAR